MKLRILFTVDGDRLIGLGHVYRALNLAHFMKNKGNKITFVTKTNFAKKMISKYFRCLLITKNFHINEKALIKKIKPDRIIIDKLKESNRILDFLQKQCSKLIAIDYTGSNKHRLNYGVNILYQKSGLNSPKTVSGFKYTILNDSFLKINSFYVRKKVQSILVIQGGADTHNLISKIIKALNSIENNFRITVILGPAFDGWDSLNKSLEQNHKPIKILNNVRDMPAVMIKHDIAITGGGITLLELCHLGIPSIVVCGEKFEEETSLMLQKKGFGINLGYGINLSLKVIAKAVEQLLNDYEGRRKMNKIGKKIIDGNGISRVSNYITKLR